MQEGTFMSLSVYHDQIKSAILDQMSQQQPLHKRDIKGVMDDVKNQYLWNSKIATDELTKIITHFKSNWQDFKEQTKNMRRATDLVQFRRYQV